MHDVWLWVATTGESLWAALKSVAWFEWAKAFLTMGAPAAAFFVLGLALLLFKPQIRTLIPRLVKVTKEGVSFAPTQNTVKVEVNPREATAEVRGELETRRATPPTGDGPSKTPAQLAAEDNAAGEVLRNEEDRVRAALADLEKSVTVEEERKKQIVRAGAELLISLNFERLYVAIFDSQLTLLGRLGDHVDGLSPGDVENWFRGARKEKPWLEDFTFTRWLLFLTSNNLIQLRGERWFISSSGSAFLGYVARRGYLGRKAV